MAARKISADAARRIALAAHGFDRPRPSAAIGVGHIRRTIRRLKLLQLDFVNVLTPAHLLVLFSRLGPFATDRFHHAVYRDGHFTEQWAHEASIVPADLWPVLAHRREAWQPYPHSPIMKLPNKDKYLQEIIEITREKAPVTVQDLPDPATAKRRSGDWNRSLPRWALECHFGTGNLAVRERLANFQRVYDFPERVIPDRHRERTMCRQDAERELLRRAAEACGIGTLQDLADYFRMSPRDAAPRVEELVAGGELEPVTVPGWPSQAYLTAGARTPRRIDAAALLSPFDPVVWFRPRAERLYDFHYRIEIYVPAPKRRWGYYVLPFLFGDRIVARVDLKADRRHGVLCVLASHEEPGIDRPRVANALAAELRELASWLSLGDVKVARKGHFASELGRAMTR